MNRRLRDKLLGVLTVFGISGLVDFIISIIEIILIPNFEFEDVRRYFYLDYAHFIITLIAFYYGYKNIKISSQYDKTFLITLIIYSIILLGSVILSFNIYY